MSKNLGSNRNQGGQGMERESSQAHEKENAASLVWVNRPGVMITIGSLVLLLAALTYPMILYRQGIVGFRVVPIQLWYGAMLGYGGILVGLTALLYAQWKQSRAPAVEHEKSAMQDGVLRALRAQRHDVLNELTLASSYLDMGRTQEARQVLAFLAMNVSERHEASSLPSDAWLTIIRTKQKEAERRGITFTAELRAPGPNDVHRLRYLPRIIGNFLDNAFEAASQDTDPFVRLNWEQVGDGYSLAVTNNGPGIPREVQDQVFKMGYSTKGGEHRGWGLVLCEKMARKIHGTISFQSDDGLTTFVLQLPAENSRDEQHFGYTG